MTHPQSNMHFHAFWDYPIGRKLYSNYDSGAIPHLQSARRQSVFGKRNENTEYFALIQYDFQKDKPKTISEIHSKGVKSSRLSNLMRLKVR